jgi:hypothetical protein
MRTMDEPVTAEAIRLARDVRPQAFGRRGPDRILEPVVEPAWPGQRVIIGVDGPDATLFVDGEVVDGHDDIRGHLARQLAATADAAILDGYLTKQIVNEDAVIYTGTAELPSTGKLIAQSMVGTRRNRAEEAAEARERATAERTFEEEDVVNLVLTDLLWLDDQWLLEVPLLERKRVLESLLPGDELVRTGLYVRPPIATWIGSWRAQGFNAITFKEANSRYHPGTTATDWTTGSMPRR